MSCLNCWCCIISSSTWVFSDNRLQTSSSKENLHCLFTDWYHLWHSEPIGSCNTTTNLWHFGKIAMDYSITQDKLMSTVEIHIENCLRSLKVQTMWATKYTQVSQCSHNYCSLRQSSKIQYCKTCNVQQKCVSNS